MSYPSVLETPKQNFEDTAFWLGQYNEDELAVVAIKRVVDDSRFGKMEIVDAVVQPIETLEEVEKHEAIPLAAFKDETGHVVLPKTADEFESHRHAA